MKISESELRQIIAEEVDKVMADLGAKTSTLKESLEKDQFDLALAQLKKAAVKLPPQHMELVSGQLQQLIDTLDQSGQPPREDPLDPEGESETQPSPKGPNTPPDQPVLQPADSKRSKILRALGMTEEEQK